MIDDPGIEADKPAFFKQGTQDLAEIIERKAQQPLSCLFMKAKGVGEEVRGRLSGLTNPIPEPFAEFRSAEESVSGTALRT